MNNLERKHIIKRENLNGEHYFQSIIEEAQNMKLLSDSELEDIRMQIIKLLKRLTERYTSGESSSVRVETAQSILLSILYSIGVYLKSFPDADMSLEAIKNTPLDELYKHGRKIIEKNINISKHILHLIQKERVENDNIAYNNTIDNGLPEFFNGYDADYAAHDGAGSIDYPLNIDKMDLCGIEYIYSYLEKLFWENKFCENFDAYDIECILRGYDEKYQDLLINIFKIVYTNALGCILANKNLLKLEIGPMDRQYILEELRDLSESELYGVLKNASAKLCKELDITNEFLLKYISFTTEELCKRLKTALENGHLESIFVNYKEKVIKPVIHFMDGDKMEDEQFRELATEIRECRFVSDKIAIINKEIHSISDLVDIFEGDCLFGDEFIELFNTLGDNELAMLSNLLPVNKLDSTLADSEKEWHLKLVEYFEGLDLIRRNSIIERADKIDLC